MKLTGSHRGPGDGVVIEVVIDVDGISWIRVFESARDGDCWAESLGAAARDGDLGTGDVELGDAGGPRVVDGEGLDAHEVVSRGDAAGDGKRVCL